jgi:GAF domain-containing protein
MAPALEHLRDGAKLEAARVASARAMSMVDQDLPLRLILGHLASAAEQAIEGRTVASILVIDKEGLLRNGASPNLPTDYLDAIDRIKPDPNVGTCAAAAATGQEIVTLNFQDDSRWSELRHLPAALGFAAGWSVPLKSSQGGVIGTFGIYFREQRGPSDFERRVMGPLTAAASRAIERNTQR